MLSESLLRERLTERGVTTMDVRTPAAPDSTNNLAKALARQNPPGPVLIAADYQTGGRGRQGKSFVSPPGGLYLSVLLPTGGRAAREIVGVTSCAAVAVARAVDELAGCRTRIKWVNDVLLGEGKLAGILCETVGEAAHPDWVVVGAGVNLCSAPLLPDAAYPPVSLADAGLSAEPEALAAGIAARLLEAAQRGFSFAAYADEYRARSIVLGRRIAFTQNGVTTEGEAVGIGDDGSLVVRCAEGECRLTSGEISVRPLSCP
ncbi:MAG: biotin--[acetyl-CoA-carboxylase] ligase [Clostridiales bacterium]|nr:biotin--[acetyl-CoA-carboxylase] ligase [Clostridiales bacterium]